MFNSAGSTARHHNPSLGTATARALRALKWRHADPELVCRKYTACHSVQVSAKAMHTASL